MALGVAYAVKAAKTADKVAAIAFALILSRYSTKCPKTGQVVLLL